VGHFALLDPDPDSESGCGSTDQIASRSNPDLNPKHWWKRRREGAQRRCSVYKTALISGHHSVHYHMKDICQQSLWIIFAGSGFASRYTAFAVGNSTLSFEPRIIKTYLILKFSCHFMSMFSLCKKDKFRFT
jgi:hypothetical protein